MTVIPPVDPNALPDYSSLVTTALVAPNFAQLEVAAFQAINAFYADAATPPLVIDWLQQYAGDKTAIDATLQKFLCFVVVDPKLLPFAGALQQADLLTLASVLTQLLSNFIAAAARAKAAA
jgi:hypothetical protein